MTTHDTPAPPPTGDPEGGFNAFPIVGIGASAGGLEAFTQLLENLPEKTGMAFILVQHLDPRHISRCSGCSTAATPSARPSSRTRGPARGREA